MSRLLPGSRGSKRRLFISPCVWRRKAPWHSWISSARTGQTRRSLCLICLNRGLARRISPKAQRALCSLHSNCLERRTAEGNTALHYSVLHHKPESLKLLLKAKAVLHTGTLSDSFFFFFLLCTSEFTRAMTTSSLALPTVNSAGETALDAAKRLQYTQCIELVSSASAPSSSLAIYRGCDCKNSSISSRKCRT